MTKKFYLETHGCQMNVHDSEKASFALSGIDYEMTQDPVDADLILLNTCMVREKAARKVFSRISEIKSRYRKNSKKSGLPLFGVMGCVAQSEAERIFEKSRDVKLVLGTQAISKLPELMGQLEQGFSRAIDVRLSKDADFFELKAESRQTRHSAYLTITEGCNKFCSFCIVPFTRGRERSRPADSIVGEARDLAVQGFKEIYLLGQNVNSYGLSGKYHSNALNGLELEEGGEQITFARLLERVARESGIPRIKFTTSYPRDFDEEIVRVIDDHENLCEWIHLPVQSGSNRMLRAMRRGYSRQEYMLKIEAIRRARKEMAITGDIIIGFPGETEDDFNETLSLAAEVEYDGLYIFNYSPRPKTPAAAFTDSVPDSVKTERFQKLQELQDRIQSRRFARFVGRIEEVLVEGKSARSDSDFTGHTRSNLIVNFPADQDMLGKIAKVKILQAKHHSLYGELI
ncbi:MAG: tRNA (N6-isopentenyl adenosine(37)-C2)-methylthiotransferase MiaB [Acidobacteria bacterium]|nr:tRNA (N6-isopentenyl adenosine(37)-C2)-methylthiotransferase MiaB [Acidobacteriota bacterium]